MKPFLKYVYVLHILAFLGYNQDFARISAPNFIGGTSAFSELYRPPAHQTARFQALVCEELKEEKDDNEHYSSDNTVVLFVNHVYRSLVGPAGSGTIGDGLFSLHHESGSLYLFFRSLRI